MTKLLYILLFVSLFFAVFCGVSRVITVKLTADPLVMNCSQQSFLTCESSYLDVDYAWYSTGGQILYSQGNKAVFTAFQEGKYIITCRACDDKGNCGEDSISIKVNYNSYCR